MQYRSILTYGLPILLGVKRCVSMVDPLCNHSLRILLYHNVPRYLMDAFKTQIRFLQKHYQFVDVAEFERIIQGQEKLSGHKLLLSFDDGFKSNLYVAKEILIPLKIKALFFVSPGFVNCVDRCAQKDFMRNRLLLSAEHITDELAPMHWDDLGELIKAGHTIGSHTMTHACLSEILSPEELSVEIVESKTALETCLQQPVNHFAYPLGDAQIIDVAALSLALKNYRYVYSGVRGNCQAPSRVFYRDCMDLHLNNNYARLLVEGGLDFYYKGARKKLDSMAKSIC